MTRRLGKPIVLLLVVGTAATCVVPPPAAAIDLTKPICGLAGLVSTVAGKVCSVARHPGRLLDAGRKLLGGHLGGALGSLSGSGGAVRAVTAGAAITAIVGWVTGGTKFALHETASVIASTSRPELQSSWFSASYWRMAAISTLLTVPFLFAAAIQAVLRSDLAMLARSTLVYLPTGLLAVSIAAPLTMLLLSASDELSAIVSSASGSAGGSFLSRAGALAGGLDTLNGSAFLTFVVGLLTVAATVTLWIELLIRSAAVYVIVLMLPLFFAALVWPARRVWAMRVVEVLVALILSKFAIVAVLSLGSAALGHAVLPSLTRALAGTTLIILAAFCPWALLRLLPLHELAAGLDGLRTHAQPLALGPVIAAANGRDDAESPARRLSEPLPEAHMPPGELEDADPEHAGGEDEAPTAPNVREAHAADVQGHGPAPTASDVTDAPAPDVPEGSEPEAFAPTPCAPVTDPVAASSPKDTRPPMSEFWQARNFEHPVVVELDTLARASGLDPSGPPEAPPQRERGEEYDPRPPAPESDEGWL